MSDRIPVEHAPNPWMHEHYGMNAHNTTVYYVDVQVEWSDGTVTTEPGWTKHWTHTHVYVFLEPEPKPFPRTEPATALWVRAHQVSRREPPRTD